MSMSLPLLDLQERISVARSLGESHFREFKSAVDGPPGKKAPRTASDVAADIARTLVAFANADGGELLIGVEDDGEVTGVPHTADAIQYLIAAPQTHVHRDTPLPTSRAVVVHYEKKIVLYFAVQKGTEYVHLTADGRCLQRRDRDSLPIPSEQIVLVRSEKGSREYDRQFVDGARVDDLDLRLVLSVAQRISKGMSAEKCLQHLDLAEYDGFAFRLRRAALLLFARQPARWHPRSQVRVLKISGTQLLSGERYNVTTDQEVTDNVLTLMETSWDLLRPHLTETRLSAGALFKAQILYPEAACREALINAIAHRDYSNEGRGIEVHVFDDRLSIQSPGSLLATITVKDLQEERGVHQSRNSFIARVLREVGYMRELGEGMRRIYELMRNSDLAPPELASGSASFAITLHHSYIYSREERLWLDQFVATRLTREQKVVVRLGYDGRLISPREIWDQVGIVDTDYYRKLIESLSGAGILKRKVDRAEVSRLARARRTDRKRVGQYVIVPPATRPAIPPPIVDVAPDPSDYVRVFVGNIPFDVTEDELRDTFQAFGEISEIFIPLTAYSERNKGYAFIEFETSDAAERAIAATGQLRQGDRTVYVQPAHPKAASRLNPTDDDGEADT